MTKCLSVHGMTALGLDLSTQIRKYKRKDKNAQIKITKCNSVHCMTALGLDLSIHFSDKHKNTNTNAKTKMHKYKLTKCPSVHGMTALGWCLPLHSSDKHKYANTKEQKCKKYKHKNTQIKTDKMSFRAWYDSPWSLPAFAFLSSSRPSHSRAAGRPKTRKDFQRFNRSRTINSF